MKQALQNLKELKQTTLSIQNLYNKIKESELTSNSNEIKKYLDYLQIAREVENSKYNSLTKEELRKIQTITEKQNNIIYKRIEFKANIEEINKTPKIEPDTELSLFIIEYQQNILFSVLDEEIKNAPIQIKSKLLDIKYSRLFCDILIEPYAILNNFNMTNNHNYLIISEYTKIKTNEIVEYVIYNDTKLIIRNLLIQENYNKEKEEIIIQLIKLKTNLTILNQESITTLEHFLEISNIESPYLKEIYETIYDSKQTKSKHKVNIIKI